MNKYKIEEILSNIQFQVYSDMNFIEPLGLDKETWKELLDYITNLQTIEREYSAVLSENAELRIQISAREEEYIKLQEENEYFNYCDEEKRKTITNLRYKIERLEEDNKQLKELCDKYEEEHNNAFKLWTMKMEEMPDYEERMNYKSRNEKAIEFVNEFVQEDYYEKLDEYITHFTWNTTKENLLNKLQGVDKE